MPTLEEIRVRVERIVKDTTYRGDIANDFINEAFAKAAGRVLLPDLMSSGTVSTNPAANQVAVPSLWNYDRNLYLCTIVGTKRPISVASSIAMLARKCVEYNTGLVSGDIEICTATRSTFIYYKAPTEATLLYCAFYKKNTPLSDDTDVPNILPEHLHYDLLVSGACEGIFTEIEEGNDGVMINTNKYRKKFETAIEELASHFKEGQSRPLPVRERYAI